MQPAEGVMGAGLFQPWHIILIVIIAALLFGPGKFTAIGKGIGEGIKNFKSSLKDGENKDGGEKKS